MKKLLAKIWSTISKVYLKIVDKTKQWVPIAVNIVEGIKFVMDTPVDDVILAIVKKAIPGEAENFVIDKVKATVELWLPKILLELKLIDGIANISDPNEQLKAIIRQLKLSSDETKSIVYQGLATLMLEKLSDGKLSWSDSGAIAEYYYQHFVKNRALPQ